MEDSAEDMELILRQLQRNGYQISAERVFTAATMRAALQAQAWDIILADDAMPQFSATLLGLLGISAGTFIGFKLPETKPKQVAVN